MVAASGALALTLAACGGDSPEVEEPDTTTSAEDTGSDDGATTDEGTDSGEQTDDAGGETDDAGGETDDAGGEAAAGEEVAPAAFIEMLKSPGMENMTTFTMTMDMDIEGQAVTMSGKADMSGGAPAMDIEMEMPGMGNVHMIMVDGSAYMAMPPMTEEGQFIQMPLEDILGEDAEDFTNQIDMTSQWDEWEAGAQTVTFVGPEEVDGETLNRYDLLLDTTAIESEDTAGLPSELTYSVWLDDQNFMRQVSFDLEGAQTVMKMDGWGEPVDITAPTNIMEMPGGMPTSP